MKKISFLLSLFIFSNLAYPGKPVDDRVIEYAVLLTSIPSFGLVDEDDSGNITKYNELTMTYSLKDSNCIELVRRKMSHRFDHVENELPSQTSQRITDSIMQWYAEDHLLLTNNQLGVPCG